MVITFLYGPQGDPGRLGTLWGLQCSQPCDNTGLIPSPRYAELHSKSLWLDRVFKTIDLLLSYHHIPVETSDILKTVIMTPFRLFDFQHMHLVCEILHKPSSISWIKCYVWDLSCQQ